MKRRCKVMISDEVPDSTLPFQKLWRVIIPHSVSCLEGKELDCITTNPLVIGYSLSGGMKMGKNIPKHFWLFMHRQLHCSREFMGRNE